MNNRIINAAALVLGAFENYISDTELQNRELVLSPEKFAAACNKLEVGGDVIHLMTCFALALTRGMVENPDTVPALCGGQHSDEFTVALGKIANFFKSD